MARRRSLGLPFYTLVIYMRIAAERTARSVEDVAKALAIRRGLELESSES